ncbi:hypothetical protein SNK04_007648 [Fusarium graminearum]
MVISDLRCIRRKDSVEDDLVDLPLLITYNGHVSDCLRSQPSQVTTVSMENITDAKPDTIVEIAPDGDLILVVGSEETKLRVHSMLMMAVLKPFSVMLGPDWKEGHGIRDHDGLSELSLPDDDAVALEIICSIIHYQNKQVPRTLPACDFLAVAVVADKYGCMDALTFASETWLRISGDEPENLMLLTAAAYLFNNSQAFNKITGALVVDYDGPYLALCVDEIESIIP